jgi:hypothetical protein
MNTTRLPVANVRAKQSPLHAPRPVPIAPIEIMSIEELFPHHPAVDFLPALWGVPALIRKLELIR